MTQAQREIAELLRDLQRPAELIAVNAGLPLEEVKVWLKSGRWPGLRQGRLFDPNGLSPRPTIKPATVGHSHGLYLFANPTGKSDTTCNPL
jgi:hypothetical protein